MREQILELLERNSRMTPAEIAKNEPVVFQCGKQRQYFPFIPWIVCRFRKTTATDGAVFGKMERSFRINLLIHASPPIYCSIFFGLLKVFLLKFL